MTYAIGGARGRIEDPEKIIRQVQEWASSRGGEGLLADARAVFGRDHIESAVRHAVRAQSGGNMVAHSISLETLRYLAAQRQVTDAIRAAGIRRGTEQIAVVLFRNGSLEDLFEAFGWSRDDSILEARGKSLDVLGITEREAATVPAEDREALALEKVALLDVVR